MALPKVVDFKDTFGLINCMMEQRYGTAIYIGFVI